MQRFNVFKNGLEVRVTGRQHGGKPGRFFFATAAFTGLFEMPMIAHGFKRAFAIDFFLQSAQGFINGFAFFQFNFCQTNSLPLQKTREQQPSWLPIPLSQGRRGYFQPGKSQPAKTAPSNQGSCLSTGTFHGPKLKTRHSKPKNRN